MMLVMFHIEPHLAICIILGYPSNLAQYDNLFRFRSFKQQMFVCSMFTCRKALLCMDAKFISSFASISHDSIISSNHTVAGFKRAALNDINISMEMNTGEYVRGQNKSITLLAYGLSQNNWACSFLRNQQKTIQIGHNILYGSTWKLSRNCICMAQGIK